eukprot:GHUV01034060.1.p1 GENE.GHUV01034060.1~~GHUV01034060.1.p1  ORF type:complete len:105 (+),score=24.68 GHUV01034060.1:407-721(+)
MWLPAAFCCGVNPILLPLHNRLPHALHLQAKGLFQKLSVPAKVIELDVIQGGSDLQLGLQEVTGRRTVPQVFIGGKHVGGCDDTIAAYQSGDLKQLLAGVGYQI